MILSKPSNNLEKRKDNTSFYEKPKQLKLIAAQPQVLRDDYPCLYVRFYVCVLTQDSFYLSYIDTQVKDLY